MSKKCKAFSISKLGLEPPDNRKAFYAGWDAALENMEKEWVGLTDEEIHEMSNDFEEGYVFYTEVLPLPLKPS